MPVVSSQYWNSTHGLSADDVECDAEGLQTMRTLADNMAWLLQCIDHAKGVVPLPEIEERITTHYISEADKQK